MANTIKLKTGSGSDPSASDLVVGELAIRTDSGKIFLKKDNGAVAEVSGGGGIDDGDKGDITVSNGGDTFTIDNGVVTSAKIADDTIVNADINASAAISGSKITPSFGSQNVNTSGNYTCSGTTFTFSNNSGGKIRFLDTNNNPDYNIESNQGEFEIYQSSDDPIIKINTDKHIDLNYNVDCAAGIDVTGNISVSGTVDGVDIAARNTLFGGLTSSSGVLTNGVTGTTQGASDNTTKVATTAYVTTAISNLINGAPSALDTLNELAAAMNDDAAFSTTVTNSLATKMPLAGGQFTGNITFSGSQTVDGRDLSVDGSKLDGIESGATADQTASEILTLIKTVDGAGSGLDADTLDGISSASFLRSDASDNMSQNLTLSLDDSDVLNFTANSTNDNRGIAFNNKTALSADYNDGYLRLNNNQEFANGVYTPLVMRADGGFNVDGTTVINGSGQVIAAQVQTLNQNTTGSAATLTTARTIAGTSFNGSANIDISYTNLTNKLSVGDGGLTQNNFTNTLKSKLDGIAASATNVTNTNQLTNGAGFITATLTNEQVEDIVGGMVTGNTESGITVTYQDGDGTLDFSVASQTDNNFTNADHSKLDGIESNATADQTASEILTLIKTVDGAGSGLDADTLDGVSSAGLVAVGGDTMTGTLRVDISSSVDGILGEAYSNYFGLKHSEQTLNSEYMILSQDTHTFISASSGSNVYIRGGGNSSTNQLIVSTGGVTVGGNSVLTSASSLNASNIGSGTIPAARVPTLNQNTTGSAATLTTARTIAGVSFDGSANISLNNNAITNGAGYLTSVTTSNIADDAINSAKIANGAINAAAMLSDNIIQEAKIQNSAVATAKIADDAVTYAKIQNVSATNRILGRDSSGAGVIEEITPANLRTMINVEDGATADQTASEIVALVADQTIAPSTIDMEDGEMIKLGNSDDLLLYHNSSDSYVQDNGTGKLVLSTNGERIDLYDNTNTATLARFITGGSVELYEAGNKKFETSTSGATITGTCTATAFSGDGSALTGISAGATGGGSDEVFYENGQTVTTNYTITNGKNAMAAGPITINSGVTVTVGSGETLTIV